MKMRKGLGKGMGMGYKNLAPMDSHIHSMSAQGVKSLTLTRVPYGTKKTPKSQREYVMVGGSPVGTIQEWKDFAKKSGIKKLEVSDMDGQFDVTIKAMGDRELYDGLTRKQACDYLVSQGYPLKKLQSMSDDSLATAYDTAKRREPKHYPKPKYNKCNAGHEMVEVYDERRNAYVWDCPICMRKMEKARMEDRQPIQGREDMPMRETDPMDYDRGDMDFWAKAGWNRMSNVSMYVGQHTSYWTMPSKHNTYGKTRDGKKFRQPLDFVIAVDGETGNAQESGHYKISWFKGFTSRPSSLFAITPAYNMNIAGKEYELKREFDGRLGDVNKVRTIISEMITKTGKLPTEKDVTKEILKREKQFNDYTVSNWIYDAKKGDKR